MASKIAVSDKLLALKAKPVAWAYCCGLLLGHMIGTNCLAFWFSLLVWCSVEAVLCCSDTLLDRYCFVVSCICYMLLVGG